MKCFFLVSCDNYQIRQYATECVTQAFYRKALSTILLLEYVSCILFLVCHYSFSKFPRMPPAITRSMELANHFPLVSTKHFPNPPRAPLMAH